MVNHLGGDRHNPLVFLLPDLQRSRKQGSNCGVPAVFLERGPADTEERYRQGAVRAVEISAEEPLRRVVDHFADCIVQAQRPIADGAAGLRVVRWLEAADSSLEMGGRIVFLVPEGVAG
jgi:predicted dehydrogenase